MVSDGAYHLLAGIPALGNCAGRIPRRQCAAAHRRSFAALAASEPTEDSWRLSGERAVRDPSDSCGIRRVGDGTEEHAVDGVLSGGGVGLFAHAVRTAIAGG